MYFGNRLVVGVASCMVHIFKFYVLCSCRAMQLFKSIEDTVYIVFMSTCMMHAYINSRSVKEESVPINLAPSKMCRSISFRRES